jgi:hypothetical protein
MTDEIVETSTTMIDYKYDYDDLTPTNPGQFHGLGTRLFAENIVTKQGPVEGYRRIIAEGGDATTNLNGTLYEFAALPMNIHHRNNYRSDPHFSTEIRLSGNLLKAPVGIFDFSSYMATSTHADNLAASRFGQEMASVYSSFKGLVFTGELPELLHAIRSPFKALREGVSNYLKALRVGGPRFARRTRLNFVRDTWLEWSFGWAPVISDLDNAIDSFYRSRWVKPLFKMVKASGRDIRTVSKTPNSDIDIGYGWKLSSESTIETDVLVKYYGIYHSSGSGPDSFSSYGFSPWEFVPTLWELIPYSFLVDYFTNIGDLVSSWSYRNLHPAWVARTQRSSVISSNAGTKVWLDPNTSYADQGLYSNELIQGEPGASVVKWTQVERVPNVGFPVPHFELQVPGMGLKWVNLVALTRQLAATRHVLRS